MNTRLVHHARALLGQRLSFGRAHAPRDCIERPPEWYDEMYSASQSYQQPYYKSVYYFLWAVIADRLRQAGLRRVLEIGCGPGQLAAFLFDQDIANQYVGLDFSPRAIEFALANAPCGRFVVGDARRTKIHSEVDHDIVICTEVLEHVEDDHAVLSLFTPGKRCILTVPSFSHPSHVRVFADTAEVRGRYGPYFDDLDVLALVSPNSGPGYTDLFFLADGVRNGYRSRHAEA
jgi:SAM-dependent methyltransferase